MKLGTFTTADGAQFSDCQWGGVGPVRARLLCLHGMGSAATEFAPLGEFLAGVGMATHAPNLRANGHDPEPARIGHDFSWPTLQKDFLAYLQHVQKQQKEEPLFLIGESMGALLSITFLAGADPPLPFAGAVFFSPVFALRQKTPWVVRQAVRVLARLTPRFSIPPAWFIHGKGDPIPLTRNQEYQNYVLTAPHRVKSYTLQFTAGMGELMERAAALAPSVRLPFLLLNGGEDVFITPAQSRKWFDRAGSRDKTHLVYPACGHLLLHELNTPEILADVGAWLEARLETAPTRVRDPQPTALHPHR